MCHKIILSMQSPVFKAMIEGGNWKSRKKSEVKIADFSKTAVVGMLKPIYMEEQ